MAIPIGFEHITREQEPLAPFTWFRLGGKAQYFAEPTSVAELQGLVRQAAKRKVDRLQRQLRRRSLTISNRSCCKIR